MHTIIKLFYALFILGIITILYNTIGYMKDDIIYQDNDKYAESEENIRKKINIP